MSMQSHNTKGKVVDAAAYHSNSHHSSNSGSVASVQNGSVASGGHASHH